MPWIIFHWGTWREFIANKCAKLSSLKAADFKSTLAGATAAAVHTRSIYQFKVYPLLGLVTAPCKKLSTKPKNIYLKLIQLELISRSQHSCRSISVLKLFRHTETLSYDILEYSTPATAKADRVLFAGGCSGKDSRSSNTKQQL